jgi:hypothetical protein
MMLFMGINTSFMIYPMNPITKNPMAHACRIFMYSIPLNLLRQLTVLIGLSAFVEEDDAIVGKVLELVDKVLVLFFSVTSGLTHSFVFNLFIISQAINSNYSDSDL